MAERSEHGRLICVGAIAGAFGVGGEVRLKSFCEEPEDIARYGPLVTENGARAFEVRITRPVKGGFAARLSGVATREEAEALRGTRLCVPRARLPEPEAADEFYHADLIGLAVVDRSGAPLGRVRALHDFGAGDVIEIDLEGGKSVMIPFTRDVVPEIDLAAGRIVADPPRGTLDDGSAEEGER